MSKPDLNKRQLAIHLLLVTVPVGALIGTAVAGFEWIVHQLVWESLSRQLTPEQLCLAPTAGMILTGLIVRTFRVPSTAMADDIVRVYHEPKSDIHQASILPKITASITTIGLGCSAGLEGASKWLGGVIAWTIQRFVNRLPAYKNLHEKLEITMIAGAAAGIAAIFRAPLSGIIMGTESPYRRGMAHEALIHSLFGAAVSYVTYIFLQTAEPYFRVPNLGPLTLLQVLWCVPLGVIAGITSRLFFNRFERHKAIW
jgi:CIC family chloride channel protein